jgi:hypothetical protein
MTRVWMVDLEYDVWVVLSEDSRDTQARVWYDYEGMEWGEQKGVP